MTNTVHIVGNLGRDPHVFQNGGVALSVADERSQKKGDSYERVAEWHDVIINAPGRAKYASEHAKKGDTVSIRGEIQYRTVDGADGKKIKTAQIVINHDGKLEIVRRASGAAGAAGDEQNHD